MGNGKEPIWPAADFSRVPFTVFTDQDVFDREQDRVFHGPVWCYLALEAELPNPGDYITTFVGNTQVVVTHAEDGGFHAFINRCAHRGTTVVRNLAGNANDFTCIYHHWCYDLKGNLIGVPFERGMNGEGGMPEDFDKADHGLTLLRLARRSGVLFGSMDPDVESFEDFAGPRVLEFLDDMFDKPIEILGYWRQRMPSNWKLYYENLNDAYHAGLLHQFQASTGVFRATYKGGAYMDTEKRHCMTWSLLDSDDEDSIEEGYGDLGVYDAKFTLEDRGVVDYYDEKGDGMTAIFLALFPSICFQRISNTLATRQIRPKSPDEFELYWTVFGFADDDENLRGMRMKQSNMIGPGGLISMEDGESGVLGQRAMVGYAEGHSVIEMGGKGPIEDQYHMLQETPIRGFWKNYAKLMGWRPEGG